MSNKDKTKQQQQVINHARAKRKLLKLNEEKRLNSKNKTNEELLKEALIFYAKEKIYTPKKGFKEARVQADGGKVARYVLGLIAMKNSEGNNLPPIELTNKKECVPEPIANRSVQDIKI